MNVTRRPLVAKLGASHQVKQSVPILTIAAPWMCNMLRSAALQVSMVPSRLL